MNHLPVLKEVITNEFNYLRDCSNPIFVDCTLGLAGHSVDIAQNLNSKVKIVGIDKDANALAIAEEKFKSNKYDNFILAHDDFKNIKDILNEQGIKKIDGALIDLGVSSMQLDDKERGFSFRDPSADLDMRMDRRQNFSAEDLINTYSADDMAKIFFEYGEEQYGRNIAKNIAKTRSEKKIKTVGDLLEVIEKSVPPRYIYSGGKHFATRTFQALRIEVNKELIGLDKALKDIVCFLAPGSKLAVITFHSLEDRIVKNVFKELSTDCICPPKLPACVCGHKASVKLVNKKPVIPNPEEIQMNPRARSAKLRVVEKL